MTSIDRGSQLAWLLGAACALAAALAMVGHAAWVDTPAGSVLKLASAAALGLILTGIQRYTREDRIAPTSMDQAQVLLAVAGALIMLIIGDSLARAFGVAGAASIVRFRTPVEDPRDVTVLFLLMGLGMACGLGALQVAGLGTVFLAVFLLLLTRMNAGAERCMKVALVAQGSTFPRQHVEQVFARHHVALEPLELTTGDAAMMRYRARVSPQASLEDLSAQLLNGGSMGIKQVTWEASRKNAWP